MSKILKNNTASPVFINDTGQTVPASGQLEIDPAYFELYSRSEDVLSLLGDETFTMNDGTNDLVLGDAVNLLRGFYSKEVAVGEQTPFAAKKIKVGGVLKSLYKRVHGVGATVPSGQTVSIDFVIPYPHAKFTGAEIFGCEIGDTLDFTVHDTPTNAISGLPVGTYGANVMLNQFGFDVEMPPERYKNTSDYDADLYQGMVIRCSYTNNGQNSKHIGMNAWLHEVKS